MRNLLFLSTPKPKHRTPCLATAELGWLLIALTAPLLITGCATSQSNQSLALAPWNTRKAALKSINIWQISGRVSVTSEGDGWHATFNWVQRGENYSIDLIGPLGQGRVRIWSDGQNVQLRTADKKHLYASDPDQLVERSLGMRIPVSGLVYWVRGLPNPLQPSILTGDQQGRLTRLEQNGWFIDYLRYDQQGQWDLPSRIRARQEKWAVKMVIKNWNLDPTMDSLQAIQAL